jgi:hypothetical protein
MRRAHQLRHRPAGDQGLERLDLGELALLTPPRDGKFLVALGVIAQFLHEQFAADPSIRPGASFESCVLCSLTVVDYLRALGLEARPLPCQLIIVAHDRDRVVHSLGLGVKQSAPAGRWAGHMAVEAQGYLIDTTLYEVASREQWAGAVPVMIACPITWPAVPPMLDQEVIEALGLIDGDYMVQMVWTKSHDPEGWRNAPDCAPDRRRQVVEALLSLTPAWCRDGARPS